MRYRFDNALSAARGAHRLPGLLTLVIALAGIFIAGTLIGLIASAVASRSMRCGAGRSNVLEEGHTVILGCLRPGRAELRKSGTVALVPATRSSSH